MREGGGGFGIGGIGAGVLDRHGAGAGTGLDLKHLGDEDVFAIGLSHLFTNRRFQRMCPNQIRGITEKIRWLVGTYSGNAETTWPWSKVARVVSYFYPTSLFLLVSLSPPASLRPTD